MAGWLFTCVQTLRVAVTKHPSVNFSVAENLDFTNGQFRSFETRSYLAGVTAAQLRRHQSNMNVILNKLRLSNSGRNGKQRKGENGLIAPTPGPQGHLEGARNQSLDSTSSWWHQAISNHQSFIVAGVPHASYYVILVTTVVKRLADRKTVVFVLVGQSSRDDTRSMPLLLVSTCMTRFYIYIYIYIYMSYMIKSYLPQTTIIDPVHYERRVK